MPSTIIYGETTDGRIYKGYSGHFSEATIATTGDDVATNLDEITVGWYATYKRLYRSYWYFDTSGLPDNATVTAAVLSLYLASVHAPSNGMEIVLYHSASYPHDPLQASDFNRALYTAGGSDVLTVYNGQSGYKTWTFNSTGCGWINLTGTTGFCLRVSFDISPTIPTDNMRCNFYAADKGGFYRPKLDLTYGTKATIVTDAATDEGSSYATGNGTVSDQGDGSPTEYGFIWNDDGSDPVNLATADNKATSSNLSGGAFSASIAGLDASTTYNYRAYMTTEYGNSYGSAVEFTTAAAPPVFVILTKETTLVADTQCTLQGEIVEDVDSTVIDHGFVWRRNRDPGTPTNPTGAENCVQLSTGAEGTFSTGVTGLTSGSVYFVRAYATTGGGTHYARFQVIRTGTPATGSFYSNAYDGFIRPAWATYDGDELYPTWLVIGDYRKSFVFFDTSSIPTGAVITKTVLGIYGFDVEGYPAWNLWVGAGMPLYPRMPLESGADGGEASWKYDYTTGGGHMDALDWSTGGYNEITFNSLGRGWIQKGPDAITKFALLPAHDYSAGKVYGRSMEEGEGYKPHLYVEWAIPAPPVKYPKANIGDEWKTMRNIFANIGDEWRLLPKRYTNIGDEWKELA